MLEIIAIIALGKSISKIIRAKGLKPLKYILLMVFLWITFEFVGLVIGTLLFGEGIGAYLMALPGAALGGYLSYRIAVNARGVNPEYNLADFGREE